MYNIRKFKPDDASNVSTLIRRSLTITNSQDYSKDIIENLVGFFSPVKLLELSQCRHMLVAKEGSTLVGTGALGGDTIYALFVDPGHHYKGIGRRLMTELEEVARSNGHVVLNVPSSITGFNFYCKLGFKKEKESFSSLGGRTINMTKSLFFSH